MKKIIIIAVLAFALLFALSVYADNPGCCCVPIEQRGYVTPDHTQCDVGETFAEIPPETIVLDCDIICEAELAPPIEIPPEVIPADCSSPFYKPEPTGFKVEAVKGRKFLKLTWDILLCNAYSVAISRCKDADCTDFVEIVQVSPVTTFVDTDPDLLWNTDYMYQIVANYIVSGLSDPATAPGNAGDIECWGRGDEEFCISSSYYDGFLDYLKANGYLDTTQLEFMSDFDQAVDDTFLSKFNQNWYCNPNNLLGDPVSGKVTCTGGDVCVADDEGATCVSPQACGNGEPFGLFFAQDTCEGPAGSNYCFFDRSHGSVDNCYTCDPRMKCADYRSEGACDRDPCRTGACEWRPVFPDIGIGVCIDTRFPNCAWCVSPGTPGMENSVAHNEVFDQCNARKAIALSIEPDFPCTYNVNDQTSNACDATACMDYADNKCTVPPGKEISLDTATNAVVTASDDICEIDVCEVMPEIGCVKNHAGDDEPDCEILSTDRRQCELDYFPPETDLVPRTYRLGRMDWLNIRMLDKFNATHDGELMAGRNGYSLHVCVLETGDCSAVSEFANTSWDELNFNDLNLQGGRDVLATMNVGENTLRFYSIDNRKNPEVVKEMTIIACDHCQGPKVIDVNVTPSRLVDDVFYTISDLPVVRVSFNELATLVSAVLVSEDTFMPVTVNPASGANYDYDFVPLSTLEDGTYTLAFNAKDDNGLLMDEPGTVTFVVDTTPGFVKITPPDGAIINVTSVDIEFEFEGTVTILEAYVEEEVWISPYASDKLIIDLAGLLTTDDIVFTTTLTGLSGGKKNIYVRAEDFAGNLIIGKSSFWIDTGLLQLRMRKPTWGVSNVYKFDVVVDTTREVDICRYVYDVPVAPPESQFGFFAEFDETTGVTHTIIDFKRIPAGDLKGHGLHVYCELDGKIVSESFVLRVDPTPPNIISAFAQPELIAERRSPGKDIFTTYLKVQTDDDGFCKYSEENEPFVLMDGLFAEFDVVPKKSHDAEVNVTQDMTEYTYYVACKNTAEMPSETVPVTFSVNLSIPFSVTSYTPEYSNVTDFDLRVETNKRSFCFVGDDEEAINTPMGIYNYSYAHVHPVKAEEGNNTWYIRCSTGASGESASTAISVIVDTSPPEMDYVNDTSNLPKDPEYSYFLDRLLVQFLGHDDETEVNAYYYRVTTFFANVTVRNWTRSTNTQGTSFWVTELDLTDGNKYKFDVYPVNIVGLVGDVMESDGVEIDVEKQPEKCQNGAMDDEESDIDCGGECIGCLDGANCNSNADCLSNFCDDGICSVVSCDDTVKNGNETDIDCGGGFCLPCAEGLGCIEDNDCVTGSCNFGTCGEADSCDDGVLTGTETDIDCGGSCSDRCQAGQNCQTILDCAEDLLCLGSTCMSERDSDGDGVPDAADLCPNTPSDEVADQEGCSPSQKFTCGDEISDGWRIRYFDSVLCGGDGAPGADPDGDGLTNSEEYRYGTDPTLADTDFDGWSDKKEIDKGYNPLDPTSHPPSAWRILLWILLTLLILAAIGVGGYLGYKWYEERKVPEVAPARPHVAPPRRAKPWPSVIERLRSIARKEEPPITDRDWLSLTALAERAKKEKVPLKEDVFNKLKGLISGKIPRKEAPGVLKAIEKDARAFKLLRKITVEKLTAEEKAFVRKRLALLKEGRLTRPELEVLLKKLRIIADYYRKHKKQLEKELEEWLGKTK